MSPIAVVGGYFVRYPLGGHVLSILHWLVGLKRVGCDVVFVEHHGWSDACFDPRDGTMKNDPSYGISILRSLLERFGIQKWCYIDFEGNFHGLSPLQVKGLCQDSEVMLALWTPTWIDQFFECSRRVFIDTDPGFTQFGMKSQPSCSGFASPYDFHHHFTYGVRIGKADCPIPTHGFHWRPLRPPVVLEIMPMRPVSDAAYFTTVMKWNARPPLVFNGEEYGQKDVEFWRIADLPKRVGRKFEIALGGNAPREKILQAGWRIADPVAVASTPWTYCDYIAGSLGEFSVAVNLEVKSRSGWFSDRTAAYLAMARPAIVQDTGFSDELPCGAGLFAFGDIEDAVTAVQTVTENHRMHCAAARRVAEEYFDSDLVISDILRKTGQLG